MRFLLPLCLALTIAGCARLETVGQAPAFSPIDVSAERRAMAAAGEPYRPGKAPPRSSASLWNAGRGSLLGDRRAQTPGDILTVVIEIDDGAEISNSTGRSRSGSQSMSIGALFGLTGVQALSDIEWDPGIDTSSSSSFTGDGSVSRAEQLTLRIAATVLDTLPNGVLQIQGTQEVRVNFELRELVVTGFVRPEDISRQNEIPYDKIASARISYGGRGQITDVQQPRYGDQVIDILAPM